MNIRRALYHRLELVCASADRFPKRASPSPLSVHSCSRLDFTADVCHMHRVLPSVKLRGLDGGRYDYHDARSPASSQEPQLYGEYNTCVCAF